MAKNSIAAIPMASFNTTGLTTSYKVIDSAGFDEAIILLRINNASDKAILVSYDGTNDGDYVDADSVMQVSFCSADGDDLLQFPKGTKVYVKGTGAGTGLVYLTGYYRR